MGAFDSMGDADKIRQWNALGSRVRVRGGDPARGEIALRVSRRVYAHRSLSAHDDAVTFPGGQEGHCLRLTTPDPTRDGVVVVAITPQDTVLLVRQFRHAPRTWMVELPRGFAQGPSGVMVADACRDLLLEAGYALAPDEYFPLGRFVTDSGKLHDAPFLVMGRARPVGLPRPEATEPIRNVCKVRFSELEQLAAEGVLCDVFTLAALARLRPHFVGDRWSPRLDLTQRATLSDPGRLFRQVGPVELDGVDPGPDASTLPSLDVSQTPFAGWTDAAMALATERVGAARAAMEARGSAVDASTPEDTLPGSATSVETL